jgi:hypothetical protein
MIGLDLKSCRIRSQRKLRCLLRELQALPFSSEIEVFGLAARGHFLPGDLDIMMHFRSREAFWSHPAGDALLNLSRKYRACLDPSSGLGADSGFAMRCHIAGCERDEFVRFMRIFFVKEFHSLV